MSRLEEIERTVEEKRGLSFSRLKRETSLENGVLSHHIRGSEKIEKRRKAVVHRKRCEECPLRKFCDSTCVFRVMENENRKKILEEKVKGRTNTEIAHLLDVHRSTVTYHMEELREEGLVNEEAVELLRSGGVL